MKIYVFGRGFESITTEGAMEIVLSMVGVSKPELVESFEKNLNDDPEFSGVYHFPLHAVNCHISDIWISCVENPKAFNDAYFVLAREHDKTFEALGFLEI